MKRFTLSPVLTAIILFFGLSNLSASTIGILSDKDVYHSSSYVRILPKSQTNSILNHLSIMSITNFARSSFDDFADLYRAPNKIDTIKKLSIKASKTTAIIMGIYGIGYIVNNLYIKS